MKLRAQILRRLRTDRPVLVTLCLAVLANLLLVGAYLWSRGGQTTTVIVGVTGDLVAVSVDGKLQWAYPEVPGVPSRGGIVLTIPDTELLPSLPRPRGIDSVRVIDGRTAQILFEDDFADGPSAAWQQSGALTHDQGVIGSRGEGQLALPAQDWGDVSVEVVYRNIQSGSIVLRARQDLYGVVTTVRPFHWNEDATKWVSVGPGRPGTERPGTDIQLSRAESMKSLVAMLTRPYPYALILGLIALAVVAILQFAPERRVREMSSGLPQIPFAIWPAAIALVVFVVTLNFGIANRDHIPFVPDSVAYLFQAKIFASGRLTTDPPPVQGMFDFFTPAPFALTDTTWAAQFPFAHSMMLAIGQLFGAPWIVPPLLAAASTALIFVVGRQVYNTRVGATAAILLGTSPFFLMNVTDLMSHNTGGFLLLASLACMMATQKRPLLFGALSGLAFGLLLNTRPLTALALAPPFGLFLLWQLVPRQTRGSARQHVAAFVAGGALMALLFLGWNYTITGDAFRTGYQATGVTFFDTGAVFDPTDTSDTGVAAALGSGGQHNSAAGIQNERIQLGLLLLVLHGWPQFLGLIFSLLPFLLGSRKLHDWFFLACAVATTVVWVGYERAGVMYGPRYWYEAMPFLILLAARGADRASDLLASAVAIVRNGDLESMERPLLASRAVVFGFVGVLVMISVNGWLLGNRPTWQADLVPNRASAMCCVLVVDDRIHRMVEEQDLHNALVLVDPCGNNFVCYGSVFWRNNATLDGDVVYAKDIVPKRQEIIAAYPGRTVYLATYMDELHPNSATLQPLAAR